MNSVTSSADAPTFEEYAAGAWPSLYRYAYLLTANHADAEDLAQQTLLKAYRSWSKVTGADSPTAYLRRTLTNSYLSQWRPKARRAELLRATLAQLDTHLAEPIADCLATDADGRPCLEAKSPLDLEHELRLPGGHIFHGDLSFPYAQEGTGRWGVATRHENVLLCGAGAVRGGGVSGVPGHNAAMALLEMRRDDGA